MRVRLALAVSGAVIGAVAAPVGPASADPAPPPELAMPCAQYLALAPEGKLATIRVILAYDSLGLPTREPNADLWAVRKAAEFCGQDSARTVYRALGGTAPRFPYGRVPEGSG